jgi:hypothetical protein
MAARLSLWATATWLADAQPRSAAERSSTCQGRAHSDARRAGRAAPPPSSTALGGAPRPTAPTASPQHEPPQPGRERVRPPLQPRAVHEPPRRSRHAAPARKRRLPPPLRGASACWRYPLAAGSRAARPKVTSAGPALPASVPWNSGPGGVSIARASSSKWLPYYKNGGDRDAQA